MLLSAWRFSAPLWSIFPSPSSAKRPVCIAPGHRRFSCLARLLPRQRLRQPIHCAGLRSIDPAFLFKYMHISNIAAGLQSFVVSEFVFSLEGRSVTAPVIRHIESFSYFEWLPTSAHVPSRTPLGNTLTADDISANEVVVNAKDWASFHYPCRGCLANANNCRVARATLFSAAVRSLIRPGPCPNAFSHIFHPLVLHLALHYLPCKEVANCARHSARLSPCPRRRCKKVLRVLQRSSSLIVFCSVHAQRRLSRRA